MQSPAPKTCIGCGGALAPKQRKFDQPGQTDEIVSAIPEVSTFNIG